MPLHIRPRRSALLRTRLDKDAVLAALRAFFDEPSPEGLKQLLAKGFISAGQVDGEGFRFEYRTNNPKNSQSYDIRGMIQDTPDWRLIRLKLKAHSPWMGWWMAAFLVVFLAVGVWAGRMQPQAAVVSFVVVMAVYAFANLLWIPDTVTNRVSALLANALRASVYERGQWLVPPDLD